MHVSLVLQLFPDTVNAFTIAHNHTHVPIHSHLVYIHIVHVYSCAHTHTVIINSPSVGPGLSSTSPHTRRRRMMNSGNILMRLMIVVWRWFGLLRVSRVCSLVSCCSASSIPSFEVHAPCFPLLCFLWFLTVLSGRFSDIVWRLLHRWFILLIGTKASLSR